jgi:carbon storage regulator
MESLMLVLSRKQNERIRVGDSVVVTIVRVSGDKVRIGIEAPPHIRVLRDELNPHDDLGADAGRGGAAFVDTIVSDVELRLPPAERLLSAAG